MRTVKELTAEIDALLAIKLGGDNEAKKERKRIKKQLKYLRPIKLYLEGEPREDFIKKEKSRLDNRIKIVDKNYKDWLSQDSNRYDNAMFRKAFDSQTGYLTEKKKHLAHLKTLIYILS